MPVIFTNSGCLIGLGRYTIYIYNDGNENYPQDKKSLSERNDFAALSLAKTLKRYDRFDLKIGKWYKNKGEKVIQIVRFSKKEEKEKQAITIKSYYRKKITIRTMGRIELLRNYEPMSEYDVGRFLKEFKKINKPVKTGFKKFIDKSKRRDSFVRPLLKRKKLTQDQRIKKIIDDYEHDRDGILKDEDPIDLVDSN